MLFNQFHDLAAGSGIGQIYRDAQKDYDVVRWSTNEIDAGALETVANLIDTHGSRAGQFPVVVYNPLGWERSGNVTFRLQWTDNPPSILDLTEEFSKAGGVRSLPFTVEKKTGEPGTIELTAKVDQVPALGYRVLQIRRIPIDGGVMLGRVIPYVKQTADSITLGGDFLRLTINKSTGCISSIRSNIGYEFLAHGACGNQLQFFKDTPKDYDAWNIDPGTLDVAPGVIQHADTVELLGEGSEYPSIRVTRRLKNSKFVQTIRLEGDQIDIDNDIDWHESHVLLKAAFPLAASGPFATYEIPYGTIERPTTRNNSWEKAQFEVEAIRWADLGDGKHGQMCIRDRSYIY